jgi:integrase
MLLTDLFTLYRAKRLRFKSPNTSRLYGHTIRSFAKTLGRAPTIDDLTSDLVEQHMSRIIDGGGSPASANKDRSQLLALWRFAATHKIIDRWPDVQIANEPEIVPMGWLPGDLEQLLKAAETERGFLGEVPARLWWSALFRVLLATGERIGAIVHLESHHLQGDWLLVPAEHRKGKRRDRLYPIGKDAADAVRALIAATKSGSLIFPFPYAATYLYKKLNAVLLRAGLPIDRRSKFHRMRRTVASAVAQAGGDPTAALDHASPKTTKKYIDPRIVGAVPVADILAAYLANPTKPLAKPDAKAKRTG